MLRNIVLALLIVLLSSLTAFSFQELLWHRDQPVVEQGYLDVRDWHFAKNGPIVLNGDWSGTSLTIQVPAEARQWGIQLPRFFDHASVYVNGEKIEHEVALNGVWGNEYYFMTSTPEIELHIVPASGTKQVSTDLHKIQFGTLESIISASRLKMVYMTMGRISLFVFAIYYLVLYYIGRQDRVHLYAGLSILALALVSTSAFQFHFLASLLRLNTGAYFDWLNTIAILLGLFFFGLMALSAYRQRQTGAFERSLFWMVVGIAVFLTLYVTGVKLEMEWTLRSGLIGYLILINLYMARRQVVQVEELHKVNQQLEQALHYEMAFLQAQIKPHFLYNALSTIVAFCYTNGDKAATLLRSLSRYLRYMFENRHTDFRSSLKEEMALIDTYVMIEKARFEERLQYRLEVDDDVDLVALRIPSLLIQPLVENAVRHGLFPKPEGGTVVVRLARAGDHLQVTIEDDGVGMSTEQLAGIAELRGVGLANVRMRIKQLVGATFAVESVIERGTKVTLEIPV